MFELWLEEDGIERHRQKLADGRYRLGRSADNEIHIAHAAVSRQHLEISVADGRIAVTDLGSVNGAELSGRRLPAHHPTDWPARSPLKIGPLQLHWRSLAANGRGESQPAARTSRHAEPGGPPGAAAVADGRPLVAQIVCATARPTATILKTGAIFVGAAANANLQIVGANIAPYHCRLTFMPNGLEVTNLDGQNPALLAGQPLPAGQPRPWSAGQPLQIGTAFLNYNLVADLPTAGQSGGSPLRWAAPLALLLFSCFCAVAALAAVASQRGDCSLADPACILAAWGDDAQMTAEGPDLPTGPATPTAAPIITFTPTPTSLPQMIATAAPADLAVDCGPGASVTGGWLDLPFPYQGTEERFGGTAEQFQLVSRRSRVGGRINSFFDHEYPVYPPRFGGWEPDNVDDTMVIFTGVRVADALAQEVGDPYYYSGHTGIDYSPISFRDETTPILAAAAGRLFRAEIDTDGNHMVWLIHDPDGDGFYQYATLYFHMAPDIHFDRMVALRESRNLAPIEAGQRIGTMGTTGRSTGIHLHFEVRLRDRERPFTRLDTLDPYGFFPTEAFPQSPWSQSFSWVDSRGRTWNRQGAPMDYLWIHPLTSVDDGDATGCPSPAQPTDLFEINVDIFPVLNFAAVHPGFIYLARDAARNILDYTPIRSLRKIAITDEDLDSACVALSDVRVYYFPPDPGQTYRLIPNPRYEAQPDGSYLFDVWVQETGRYLLAGRQTSDCVPPLTIVRLAGERLDEAQNLFDGPVTVTLLATDGGVNSAGIRETQYSLDCGRTWLAYERPFTVTLEDAGACGEAGVGEQGLALTADEFVLLASSVDRHDNIEEPPRQVRFTIRED